MCSPGTGCQCGKPGGWRERQAQFTLSFCMSFLHFRGQMEATHTRAWKCATGDRVGYSQGFYHLIMPSVLSQELRAWTVTLPSPLQNRGIQDISSLVLFSEGLRDHSGWSVGASQTGQRGASCVYGEQLRSELWTCLLLQFFFLLQDSGRNCGEGRKAKKNQNNFYLPKMLGPPNLRIPGN